MNLALILLKTEPAHPLFDAVHNFTLLLGTKCPDTFFNLFCHFSFKYLKSEFWSPYNMVLAMPKCL